MYFKVFDCFGNLIIAPDETWEHAIGGHPELIHNEALVMTSLVTPIRLQHSDTAKDTQLYVGPAISKGPYSTEHPVSVVRLYRSAGTTSRVWVTGYFTSLPPEGKILWQSK